MSNEIKTWEEVQVRTFTGWANNVLKKENIKISDLTAFESGEITIKLIECLLSKKISGAKKNPSFRIHKIQNNKIAIDFLLVN
jgi:hypothetical protein